MMIRGMAELLRGKYPSLSNNANLLYSIGSSNIMLDVGKKVNAKHSPYPQGDSSLLGKRRFQPEIS